MKRKAVIIGLCFIFVFCFAACETEVLLSEYKDDEKTTSELTVRLSKTDEGTLNKSAENTPASVKHNKYKFNIGIENEWVEGSPWKAREYLRVLAHLSGYEYQKTTEYADYVLIVFTKTVLKAATEPEKDDAAEEPEKDTDKAVSPITEVQPSNWFIRTFEYCVPNPFNALRAEYAEPSSNLSVPYIFKEGFNDYWYPTSEAYKDRGGEQEILRIAEERGYEEYKDRVNENGTIIYSFSRAVIPAFSKAFPIAADSMFFNPDNLTVKYSILAYSRYEVFGTDTREGSLPDLIRYTFTAKFDGSDENVIRFRYTRPNPIGWYLLAIALGGASAGLIFLIVHLQKKKKKTTAEAEMYPAGTFGQRSLNPFEGIPDERQERLDEYRD